MAVTTADQSTGTLAELARSEFINPAIMMYAHDFAVAAPYTAKLDLRGQATKVGSFPRWILDTATDITNETTNLSNETLESTDVQITAAEIGVRRDVADTVLEETIVGSAIFDFIVRDAGLLFAISLDDDICALFASLNGGTAVGTSASNLTIANMVEAQAQVRKNGMRGSLVYILDDQQASDYQSAQAASTATTANQFFTVEHGVTNAFLGMFMSQPVWQTGLCDTANTSADVVGACFVDGDTNPLTAAIGMVITRDLTVKTDRDEPNRLTQVVATAKWGVGEVADEAGVPIVTDA